MKRAFFTAVALLLSTLISTSMVLSVRATSIKEWNWRGYIFSGVDPFYRENVVAYEESSAAILDVTVKNDYALAKPINVSAVKVSFDWNVNYTSAQASSNSPIVMPHDEVRVFTISFTLPNTTVASNLYLHGYTIYVEHVNSTTGGKRIVGTWIGHSYDEDYYFAVYSSDQAAARRASQMISAMTMPDFNTTKAKLLWSRAENETNIAAFMYNQGDFASARDGYDTALSLMSQAFRYEEDREMSLDEAQLALLNAQARQIEAWANYANGMSNLWTMLGFAAILFAVGYIIKGMAAMRKASAPSPQ